MNIEAQGRGDHQTTPGMTLGWLLLALVLACAGCGGDDFGSGTVGDDGRVEFSFQRSCFFGCPLEQPLLVGARERIELSDEAHAIEKTCKLEK